MQGVFHILLNLNVSFFMMLAKSKKLGHVTYNFKEMILKLRPTLNNFSQKKRIKQILNI